MLPLREINYLLISYGTSAAAAAAAADAADQLSRSRGTTAKQSTRRQLSAVIVGSRETLDKKIVGRHLRLVCLGLNSQQFL